MWCHLIKSVYFIYNRNIGVYVLLYCVNANPILYFECVQFTLLCIFVKGISKIVFEWKPQWKTQLEFFLFLETSSLGSGTEWTKSGSQEIKIVNTPKVLLEIFWLSIWTWQEYCWISCETFRLNKYWTISVSLKLSIFKRALIFLCLRKLNSL